MAGTTTKSEGAERAYRPTLARQQFKALQDWERSGRKGPRPETPDYDAIQEQYANGGAAKAKRRRSGGPARVAPTVRYTRNGEPVTDSVNKLSTIAYHFTRGIASKQSKRLSAADFRKLLTKLGVTDPEHTTWQVELPNGVVIGAVAPGDKAPAAPKAKPAAKVAPVKKAAPAKRPAAKKPAAKRTATPRKRTTKAA